MIILSKEEIVRILHSIRQPRNKIAMALAYGTGLKLNELINLKISDINFENKTLHTLGRVLPLPTKLTKPLWLFIKDRAPEEILFLNKDGKPLTRNTIERPLKSAVRRTRLKKPITFSALRHSFAVHLLESGIDLKWLQELLGHRSLTITRRAYKNFIPPFLPRVSSPLDYFLLY